MNNSTTMLEKKSIGSLLAQYSVPAVIAMLVNAIYNVVDRMFIGQLVGEDALAALTIVFPMMMVTFAFVGLIGMGGASMLSIRLGQRDFQGASKVFGNTMTYGLLLNGFILLMLFFNLEKVISFLGAQGNVNALATQYMRIILAGMIFQMTSFILSNFVRTEGRPTLSMTAMIVSALTNIVLDYVFIALMGMGVKGAAYGTIAGQFLGLTIYLQYYLRGASAIRLTMKDFLPDFKILMSILGVGVATFISTIGTSVSMLFINKSLAEHGGAASIASMGAINSLYTFFIMPVIGITQGMQPIVGYNYGAKNMDRVYKALKMAIIIGSLFSTIVFVIMEVFAPFVVLLFLKEGSETVQIASKGLRIFILMLPILSINLMGAAFFQSIADGKASMFHGMLRQFIFLIPALIILPMFMGLTGVWLATPLADGLAVIVTSGSLMKKIKSDKMKFVSVTG